MENKNILILLQDPFFSKREIIRLIGFFNNENVKNIHILRVLDTFDGFMKILNKSDRDVAKYLCKEMEFNIRSFLKNKKIIPALSFHAEKGMDFISAIKYVDRNDIDLVVTIENKISRTGYSASSLHLIRKCPCPVWVYSGLNKDKLRVMLAVDIDLNDKVKVSLNKKIVSIANNIADNLNASLDILHLWDFKNEQLLKDEFQNKIAHHQIDEMVTREETYHSEWFSAFIKKQKVNFRKSYLLKGEIVQTLPKIVKNQKIDLFIMASLSTLAIPGMLISPRAEVILQNIRTSVLTIKPDGFVSPIQP